MNWHIIASSEKYSTIIQYLQAIEENISQQLFANIPKQKSDFAKEVKCFIVPKVV